MNAENLTYESRDGIGVLTINRPDRLNALNGQTVAELHQAAGHVAAEEGIRALIVTGSGPKAFVAGVSTFV